MTTRENSHEVVDVEEEGTRRSSVTGSGSSDVSDDDCRRRCSSQSGVEIVGVVADNGRQSSSASVCSIDQVDLECGLSEIKVHLAKVERDCRICHLSLDSTNHESGIPIELGCCCKDDLAAAHKHCAEAWFKIKGNKTCEICGTTARNVSGVNETELMEQWNEANEATTTTTATAPVHSTETRNFWQGHRFLNFLLACMVFAFVISWLFHFNVPS